MLYAGDEITQALDAEPEGFDAGFAVALSPLCQSSCRLDRI